MTLDFTSGLTRPIYRSELGILQCINIATKSPSGQCRNLDNKLTCFRSTMKLHNDLIRCQSEQDMIDFIKMYYNNTDDHDMAYITNELQYLGVTHEYLMDNKNSKNIMKIIKTFINDINGFFFHYIGKRYEDGYYITKDVEQAIEYYELSVKCGSTRDGINIYVNKYIDSIFALANIYLLPDFLDEEKAESYYLQAFATNVFYYGYWVLTEYINQFRNYGWLAKIYIDDTVMISKIMNFFNVLFNNVIEMDTLQWTDWDYVMLRDLYKEFTKEFRDNIREYTFSQIDKVTDLQIQVKTLTEEKAKRDEYIIDLENRPGGPEYEKAKLHFNSLVDASSDSL